MSGAGARRRRASTLEPRCPSVARRRRRLRRCPLAAPAPIGTELHASSRAEARPARRRRRRRRRRLQCPPPPSPAPPPPPPPPSPPPRRLSRARRGGSESVEQRRRARLDRRTARRLGGHGDASPRRRVPLDFGRTEMDGGRADDAADGGGEEGNLGVEGNVERARRQRHRRHPPVVMGVHRGDELLKLLTRGVLLLAPRHRSVNDVAATRLRVVGARGGGGGGGVDARGGEAPSSSVGRARRSRRRGRR